MAEKPWLPSKEAKLAFCRGNVGREFGDLWSRRAFATYVGPTGELSQVPQEPYLSAASAASRVFSISVATVIGPTPPGTGVIQLARCAAASKPTSPHR